MTNRFLKRAASTVALVLLASASASAQLAPEARAAFARMATALEQASSFTVRAGISHDVVQPDGQKLQFHGTTDLQLERPGRLHARTLREGTDREVWLRDGQITVLDLEKNTWARIDAPATLDGMLDTLAHAYGFSMPLADLLYSDVDEAVMGSALGGTDLGVVDVEGVACRHLAFRHPKLDWQIWIEEGERGVPRKVVITYKEEVGQPQYTAALWDWNLGARVPATLFDFAPPPGAQRVTMEPLAAPAAPAAGRDRREGR